MRLRTIVLLGLAVVAVTVTTGGIALSRIDLNAYFKSAIIDKVAQATGRELAFGGKLTVTFLPMPALTVLDVAFPNPVWIASPPMVKVGELSAQVALLPLVFGGNLRINRLVLKDVDLLLATDADGRGNWQFGAAEKSSAAPPTAAVENNGTIALPTIDEIMLQNVAIRFDDGQSHKTTAVSFKKFSASGSPDGPMKVTASAIFQGLPIEIDATVDPLSSLMSQAKPYRIDASVTLAGGTAKLTGSMTEPFAGRGLDLMVGLDGQNLGALSALLDFPAPDKPYHLAATLTGDADRVITAKALQATIGANALSGEARLTLNAARPKLSATLSATMIDLSDLPLAAAPAEARSGDGDRVFDRRPLPISALRMADADITLTAEVVKNASIALRKLSAHIILDDRNLHIEPFAFDLDTGHIAGSADLSTRQTPAVLTIGVEARHLDLGKLLAQFSGTDLFEGSGDFAVAVHGKGDSPQAIMATLDGTSNLTVGRGIIKNRYADLVGADVFREAFAWTQGKQDSKLTCMVSRFDIRSGLATSRDLLIDTNDVTIVGQGTVNLGTERLDLEMTPRPKDASLINLATPIDIGGTFKQPTIRPNNLAMAKDVAKGVATWINPLFALVPMILDSGDDKNPCVVALEARKDGQSPKDSAGRKADDGTVGGMLKSLGRSVGNIFK
jgi:hypothetical protein